MEDKKEEIDEELEAQLRKELEEDKKFIEENAKRLKKMKEHDEHWAKIHAAFEEEYKKSPFYKESKEATERLKNLLEHIDEDKRERDEMLSKMTEEEFDAWYDEINKNAEEFAKENNIKAVEVDIDDKGNVVLNKKDNK